jgi:ABC-type glycerol-3-phosphate transport system substrate-binding protein
MKLKKIICIILALCCILSGCSKNPTKDTSSTEDTSTTKDMSTTKDTSTAEDTSSTKDTSNTEDMSTTKDTSNVPKGRSIEKDLALPTDMKADKYYLTKKDNKPFLYGFCEKPCSIVGYQLDQNGTWVDTTPAWLKSLSFLPEGWISQTQIMEDASGNEYLYYTELEDNYYKGNLLRSKDGTTYETLKPEGWEEFDSVSGGYKVPSRVTITENGTLAALYYTREAIIYDPNNYKIQNVISDWRYNENLISSIGNQLILGAGDNNNEVKSLVVYNLDDLKNVKYPFEANIDSYCYCDTNEQNILLCNADGIFKLEEGTSVWNCVLDGTLTSLAMPTMWNCGFVSDASNNYYVLYNSDSGYSLKQYSFDATADTLPPKELNIYSLVNNSFLRQAAAVFQLKHKNVKVNIKTVMNEDEYFYGNAAAKEDYIRALNTELLADNNYDLLVLDGLPTDSYIEKGVLTEISDILQPMIDDGTLLKNIMDSYVVNGKSYCVPTRFALNLIMGSSPNTKQLSSLKALAEYVQAHPDKPLFGITTIEELVEIFIPYQISSLLNKKGKFDREQLIQTLTMLKQIGDNCGMVEKYDKWSDAITGIDHMKNIARGDYYYIGSVQSLQHAMYSFGVLTYVKGFYTSLENSFTPSCEIGIVSNGKQQELSKEFLRTILSEEVQYTDFYNGFAVNSKALMESPSLIIKDNTSTGNMLDAEGKKFYLTSYPLDDKQAKEVLSICTSVNKKLPTDEHIAATITKKAKDFFTGNQSASEAADAIIEELNIYLAE